MTYELKTSSMELDYREMQVLRCVDNYYIVQGDDVARVGGLCLKLMH